MTRVVAAEKRRVFFVRTGITLLVLVPLLTRVVWTAVRHDYFSVAHWPLAHMIITLYHVFMSPSMMYILAMTSATGFIFFVGMRYIKTRHVFAQFTSKFS